MMLPGTAQPTIMTLLYDSRKHETKDTASSGDVHRVHSTVQKPEQR
jgi:hypothetical protein